MTDRSLLAPSTNEWILNWKRQLICLGPQALMLLALRWVPSTPLTRMLPSVWVDIKHHWLFSFDTQALLIKAEFLSLQVYMEQNLRANSRAYENVWEGEAWSCAFNYFLIAASHSPEGSIKNLNPYAAGSVKCLTIYLVSGTPHLFSCLQSSWWNPISVIIIKWKWK